MSTLRALMDLILSGLMLAGVLVLSAVLLAAWRSVTGPYRCCEHCSFDCSFEGAGHPSRCPEPNCPGRMPTDPDVEG